MTDEFRAPSRYFEVDIEGILESLRAMEKIPLETLRDIANDVAWAAKEILKDVFEQAMQQQDDFAFPEEFRDHVRAVVNAATVDKVVAEKYASVTFDFSQLGTTDELSRAFHQGAQLAGGGHVDGPWDPSMTLKNSDETRHIFWEAIRRGDAFVITKGRDKGGRFKKKQKITLKSNAWDETKQKYIEIWGNKAPEWLYLQYGQRKWEPYIRESSIVEDFTRRFDEVSNQIWQKRLEQEVAEAQHGQSFYGPVYAVAPTGRKYYNYRERGRFARRG